MAFSSAIRLKKKYDVFISFRGTDTRKNFTSHLRDALKGQKIVTYTDDRLERGEEITPSLRTAIEESKICVIVFSKAYAFSTWCLEELAHILKCKESYGGFAIPIFHEIDPSHVRYQMGTYATAFAKHEERLKDRMEQVRTWREALTKAANLSGFDSTSSNVGDDSDLVEQVVKCISKKLNRESSSTSTAGLVGIESRIQQVVRELDITPEDFRIRSVVIWGMGGIGKTTLADAVFHRLSPQFEASCFLANVREQSQAKGVVSSQLYRLRDKLLRKLLRDETHPPIESQTIEEFVKERLQRTKVLVVLDDVNDLVQLEFLAGDQVPFGRGSRIIITTRDKQPAREMQVVRKGADHDVKIYEIKKLDGDESLQFYSNAPRDVYSTEFLKKVVDSAAGIPLALKIWHSLFLRCKRKEELEELWNKMKKFPNKELHNVYRVSYDVLEANEREVFLDIVCFHKGVGIRSAKRALDACGLFADSGINILIDMSLISIKGNTLWMHDVIQEMGWEIVREQGTKEPGKQSRLYTREDVCHVLERNTGTGRVRSIALCGVLDDPNSLASQILTGSHTYQDFIQKYKALLTDQDFIHSYNVKLTPQAFTGMHNLTFLKIEFAAIHLNDKAYLESLPDSLRYLYWDAYPWKSLPSKFSPNNLVELSMRLSKLQRLWNKGQNPQNLTRIDLRYSEELVEVPDLSKSLDIEFMNFKGCRSLVQVPSYFHNFSKLTYLNLSKCSNIGILPEMPSKMKYLGLNGTAAEELPSSIWSLKKLAKLNLSSRASIKHLPRSPRKLKCLAFLECICEIISVVPQDSKQLVRLPASIYELKSLKELDLSGRFRIKKFPEILEVMECLEFLRLHDKEIVEVPSSIENFVGLKTLEISSCGSLEFVPNSIYNLNVLEHFSVTGCLKLKRMPPVSVILCPLKSLDLSDCQLLEEVPDGLISLTSLQRLNLSGTMIQTINPTIKHASGLKYLNISNCKRLQSLPQLPCLPTLVANGCSTLKTVSYPMAAPTQDLNQRHSFCGSINLDENTRSNMMDDARLRIVRMATDDPFCGIVTLICPGIEIPKWFSCEKEGSSIKTKLPLHWSDEKHFLGFALSTVLPFYTAYSVTLQCECNLTTNNKRLHQLTLSHNHNSHKVRLDGLEDEHSDHVLMVYRSLSLPDTAKWSTEVSFDFSAKLDGQFIEVKRCGVCFLYAQGQDHDSLKFEVIDTDLEQATGGIGTLSEPESGESETSSEPESGESETCSEYEYSESETCSEYEYSESEPLLKRAFFQ